MSDPPSEEDIGRARARLERLRAADPRWDRIAARIGVESDRSLADETGLSHDTVRRMRNKLGIPPVERRYRPIKHHLLEVLAGREVLLKYLVRAGRAGGLFGPGR